MAEAKAPAALEAPSTAKVSPSSSSAQHKTLVEHLEDEDETAVYALLMPAEYTMKEGAQLWQGVRLGKFLGAGVQAKVFQLARDDGHPTGKVIKINHGDIGSKMLNNNVLWIGMDREWEIGTQLRAALQEPGGAVAGFMKVCDCLVTRKGAQGAFSGMLMEELHGWEVYKRIDTPEFHNIHYVREMLFQVFSALDRAQRKLGFHHADLGMRNIMEHYPRIWERLPAEEGARAKQEALKYKGYSCNADGSRLPLGPELEFKIIDFGVAKFSSKLAAAAGGSEAQEVVERLQEKFGQRERIRFGHDHSPASIEFEPSDVTKDQSRTSKLRNWLKLPGKNRITVIVRPALKPVKALHSAVSSAANRGPNGRASPAPSSSVGGAAAEDDTSAGSDWQPIRLTAFEEPGYKQAESAVVEERRAKKKGRRKKKSPIETMYRHFWHRKGDVFHLCLGMALALDDRCWPEEDEDLVAAFCSLVHHVTGVKLRVRTAEGDAGDKTFGRRKWQHWFRRWHIRLKSHVLPYNSGLLAREALSHPFFGAPGVRHAELPAALSKAFPAPEEA